MKALDMLRADRLRADRLRAAIDRALPLVAYIEAAARGAACPCAAEQTRMPFRPADLADDAWVDLAELVEVLESAAKDDDLMRYGMHARDIDAAGEQLAIASIELDAALLRGEVDA